ncbi:MAG TPA: hypothetical protein VH593_16205 [Ktedonobacteraceae bacterium]|jgi:hypothetical protein
MSAAEMQACLAQLYVDDAFRKLFYLEPETTLKGYKLTTKEVDAIKGVNREMLDVFAEVLKRKRKKRFQAAYPLLFKLVGADMDRYFERYYRLYLAKPNESTSPQILSFGEFMEQSLSHDEDYPPYTSELAQFERLYYAARLLPQSQDPLQAANTADDQCPQDVGADARPFLRQGVQIAAFRFNLVKIVSNLQQQQAPADVEEGQYCTVFQPIKNALTPKIFAISPIIYHLLTLCDARRSASEITLEVEKLLGKEHLTDNVVRAVNQLLSLGVIGV